MISTAQFYTGHRILSRAADLSFLQNFHIFLWIYLDLAASRELLDDIFWHAVRHTTETDNWQQLTSPASSLCGCWALVYKVWVGAASESVNWQSDSVLFYVLQQPEWLQVT